MFVLVAIGVVLFVIGYRVYGAFLDRQFGINPDRQTPAHKNYDGLDYMPAKTQSL